MSMIFTEATDRAFAKQKFAMVKYTPIDSPFYTKYVTELADATEACLKFTTKDEYLMWRATWRANYAELTKEIRQYKRDRKGPPSVKKEAAISETKILKQDATFLLYIRSQSKIKAARQRAETMNKV